MATISGRVNTLLLMVVVLMGAAIIAMLGTRAYGGPLDPSGPPAATDGVRGPGTPISQIPFAITQPGRYYLTRNLNGPGNNNYGIAIEASNVTLDLNGFTIDGGDSTGTGVVATAGASDNVSVENGAVTHYANGIDLAQVDVGDISNVRVFSLSSTVGKAIVTASKGRVEDCVISGVFTGVDLGFRGVMRACTIEDTKQDAVIARAESVVIDSSITTNFLNQAYYGVRVSGGGVTISNNRFGLNVRNIYVEVGAAMIIDNAVYCAAAVAEAAPSIMYAPMGNEPHANIPRIAAGFC